jgi:hypothetical protein
LSNLKITLLLTFLLATFWFPSTVHAQYGAPPSGQSAGQSLNDQSETALKKSQITLAGSAPFHIKFSISEPGNAQSTRHAEVEEFWLAPEKYRRIIQSPDFSQTLVVNGEAISETNTGDYYPYWLHQLITAVFDPLPIAGEIKRLPASPATETYKSNDKVCRDVHFRVDRWVICFNKDQTFESVFTKEYAAYFSDYQKFGKKLVPHHISTDPGTDSDVIARISVLEPLAQPDESMFAVAAPTPLVEQIRFLQISEDSMRKLVQGGTEIPWPAHVAGGSTSGGCGAFIVADRAGNVREVFSGGCDNPFMQQPLREALLKWKLQKPVVGGAPVQVQSLMGFPFTVQVP